jgi:hypothetical protein
MVKNLNFLFIQTREQMFKNIFKPGQMEILKFFYIKLGSSSIRKFFYFASGGRLKFFFLALLQLIQKNFYFRGGWIKNYFLRPANQQIYKNF